MTRPLNLKVGRRWGQIVASAIPATLSRGARLTISGLGREPATFVVEDVRANEPDDGTWTLMIFEDTGP